MCEQLLYDLLDDDLFNPDWTRYVSKIEIKENSIKTYKRVSQDIKDSINENILFSDHFLEHTVFYHPNDDKSYIMLITHFLDGEKKFYMIGYPDSNYESEDYYSGEYDNVIDYKSSTKLDLDSYNQILRILCDKGMVCRYTNDAKFFYSKMECDICTIPHE